MSKPNIKIEQGKATRDRLVAIAFTRFSEAGYTSTSLDRLIIEAGLTKGALYHHFRSKLELFEAVYIRAEQVVAARISAASTDKTDLWEQLLSGCDAYLETCAEPGLQRILRQDGPSVLGWKRWADIDAEYGSGKLEDFLIHLSESGIITVKSTKALSHMLSGALNEATFWIARASNSQLALSASRATLRDLLIGFKVES